MFTNWVWGWLGCFFRPSIVAPDERFKFATQGVKSECSGVDECFNLNVGQGG